MSLLQAINERNNGQAAQAAQAERDLQAESQKPNAEQQSRQQRSDLSNAVANGPDQELQDEAPTPEEQEEYSRLELEIVNTLNSPKANQMFQAINTAGDPVEGIGQVSADIITALRQQYPQTSDDVLQALGESTVEQVVEAYEEINPSVNLNEDQMAEAYAIGQRNFMDSNSDMVDPDLQEYLAGAPPEQL